MKRRYKDVTMGNYEQSILIYLTLLLIGVRSGRGQCSKDEYRKCVTMADPLLQESRLIYPDNMADIDNVCRTWSMFVDCVKRYTDKCFTDQRRQEFNRAVELPVDSVHQMCTDSDYQQEYLKHAKCMKATLTEDSHCGRHYRHLVNQVSGEAARPSLCCSHHRFRECVMDQTRRTCDPDAAPYAKQILDKAMSFLREQCSTYIPNRIDCPGADFYKQPPSIIQAEQRWPPAVRPTPGPGPLPMGGINMAGMGSQWQPPPPLTPADGRGSTNLRVEWPSSVQATSWAPSARPLPGGPGPGGPFATTPPPRAPTDDVNGVTRSSFGRGMSWSTPQTTPPTEQPSWRVSSSFSTEQPWYPEVNQDVLSNTIDEPNQQGLAHQNAGSSLGSAPAGVLLRALSMGLLICRLGFL
nr:PREDICTED: uncharacterized protein LOC109033975 isoform X2 [Bemisia tabaci]